MKIYDGDWWNAANRLYYILRPKYRGRLKSFRGKHRGGRCFLIGNGPSLTVGDLECLRNETTMVTNSIIRIFGDLSYTPTYYFAQDSGVMKDNMELIRTTPGVTKFLKAHYASRYHAKDAIYYNIYEDRIAFSPDISKGVYGGWTVMYSMMQFAAYMGFSEIYLLGVDFNYAKGDTEINAGCYFDERLFNKDMNYALPRPAITLAAYRQAREYCEAHGIRIYNATRGGKLEVFERADFDSLFINAPE